MSMMQAFIRASVDNLLHPTIIVGNMDVYEPGTIVCIDRVLGSLGLLLPIISMGLFGFLRPLPKNPDWMDKDIKVKGGLIALLYGGCFSMMFLGTLCSGRTWILSRTHTLWVYWAIFEAKIYLLGGLMKWFIMKWEIEENIGNHTVVQRVVECESPPWYIRHRLLILNARKVLNSS